MLANRHQRHLTPTLAHLPSCSSQPCLSQKGVALIWRPPLLLDAPPHPPLSCLLPCHPTLCLQSQKGAELIWRFPILLDACANEVQRQGDTMMSKWAEVRRGDGI